MEQIKALFLLQPVIGILFKLLHFQQQTYFSTKWSRLMYVYLLLLVSLSYSVPNIAHNAEFTGKKKSVNDQKQQIFTSF